jgi:hypothetical protein
MMNNPWGQQQPITQQGPMGGFRRGVRDVFGSKSNMLSAGLGLMMGATPRDQMDSLSMGLMMGQADKNERASLNKTMEYFKANRPDLAAQVEAGMPMSQAWSELKAQPTKRDTIKGADGYQYYQDDQSRVLPNVGQEAPNQTTGIQEYEYAKQQGFEGDYIDFQQAKKGNGFSVIAPDGTVVQMGGGQGHGKQDMKNVANRVTDAQDIAASGAKLKQTVQMLRKANENTGYSGVGAGAYDAIDGTLEQFGFDGLPGTSEARSMMKSGGLDIALAQVQKTKGAISNAEMNLFMSASAGLQNTQRGNAALLDMIDAIADRDIQRVDQMEQWRQQHGVLDGFESAWGNYITQNPIITEKKLNALLAGEKAKENNKTESGVSWSFEQ